MKRSTIFAQVANSFRKVMQSNGKSLRFAAVLFALLTVGVGNAWGEEYEKVSSFDNITTGDYVIIGCQNVSSYGYLTYTSLNDGRIPYTKTYTALPSSIEDPVGNNVWKLTVSSSESKKFITIFNAANSMYLASKATEHDGKYKWDGSTGMTFTIEYEQGDYGSFRIYSDSYFLGVNAYYNYWRGYAAGTSIKTNSLTLYKKSETTPSYTITAQSNNTSYGTVSLSGTTITATPKTGCRVSTTTPYEVTSGTATVSQSGNTFNVTPSSNCIVRINFEAIPTYTVNWYVNDEIEHLQTGVAGTTLTDIPNLEDYECGGKVFVGWTTAEIDGETATIPDPLYTELGDFPVVTSNMTFYAVFAKGEGDNKWIETSIDKIGDTDEVVVTMTNGVTTWALNKKLSGQNYPLAPVVEGIDGVELPSTEVETEIIWNIGGNSTDGYVFYPKGQDAEWLYCTKSGIVKVGRTTTNRFTIVNGFLKHTNLEAFWEGYLAVSTSADIPDWRMYQSNQGVIASNAQTLKLYKKTTVYTSYTNYSTSCVAGEFDITNTDPIYVTSAVGQKIKSTDKLVLTTTDMAVGTEISLSAPNITFYKEGVEITQLTTTAASETFELEIAYKPTISNTTEQPTITLEILGYQFTFNNKISCRSLPETFAIVAKVGNVWYALPSQGLNSGTTPVGYPVEVDNNDNPTAVTAVPENADWSLRQVLNDRFTANGENLVFVNAENKTLYANNGNANIQTYAEYSNYATTNPGLYEWTPTTTDLETYTLKNVGRAKDLSINVNATFGTHASNVASSNIRFLPIQDRYTPAALQVVEWKENSVVIMCNGDPAQTASVSVNGGAMQTTELSGDGVQKDIAVYELTANGLATNPTQRLSITIGSKKTILSIPYIISGALTDLSLLPQDATVAARQEVAKVADLVVLKDAKLTADGAKSDPYKFRNVTIYGGGKLVIPSEKGFGVASLTLRAGGVTDAGEYDYVYPQFELRGTFTNSAAKINYDYITDYDHWFHLVLPFAGDLETIKYPTEFYGANVNADNKGSWVIKRYDGATRATGNYEAWKDIEEDNPKATQVIAGKGYIFWGAPKKVSVNGGDTQRQIWGIQRITMSVTADDAETEKADKILTGLSSHKDVPNNSGAVNDQGWNLIGNPYMVNLKDMETTGIKVGKLVEEMVDDKWTGKWINNGDDLRYLTIPSDHFDTYTAKTVGDAVSANALIPGRAFFVQLDGDANGITFQDANRASLMPALLAENSDKPVDIETGIVLSNETLQDEVNFWIKDGKTNDYEYNADYPKTPNNNRFNIYGVHTNGDLSWVAISPELAAESMPIGYQVPSAGTYTLSLSETYYSEDLESLYVTDHEMSPEVTVDLINAPYEFSVNQAETNNERFTISLKLKSENQGPTTGWENIDVGKDHPTKFIHQDRLYILRDGVIYDATGQEIQTINK